MNAPPTAPVATPSRARSGFGGVLPVAPIARGGSTTLAALAVELHAEGALIPLLVLTDNPGPLAMDVADGVVVSDEGGRHYAASALAEHPGLGMLQLDMWVTPAPPPDVRRLRVSVGALARTAITRKGEPVSRPLSGGPWELEIELIPARTAIVPPPEPADAPPDDRDPPAAARVPLRSRASFAGIIPIGQVRMEARGCLCLWALEQYGDRGVLSLSVLGQPGERAGDPVVRRVSLWDDRGRRYRVSGAWTALRPGWSEALLETAPAVGEDARALGLRLARSDPGRPDSPADALFGVRIETAVRG